MLIWEAGALEHLNITLRFSCSPGHGEKRPEEDPELHPLPLAVPWHCDKLFTQLCALVTPHKLWPSAIARVIFSGISDFCFAFFSKASSTSSNLARSPNQSPDPRAVCKNTENVGKAPRARECPISLEFVPHFAAGMFVTGFPSLGSSEGKHLHVQCSPDPTRKSAEIRQWRTRLGENYWNCDSSNTVEMSVCFGMPSSAHHSISQKWLIAKNVCLEEQKRLLNPIN